MISPFANIHVSAQQTARLVSAVRVCHKNHNISLSVSSWLMQIHAILEHQYVYTVIFAMVYCLSDLQSESESAMNRTRRAGRDTGTSVLLTLAIKDTRVSLSSRLRL